MTKLTKGFAKAAIVLAGLIAISTGAYAQSPAPLVNVTIGLESINYSYAEEDGEAIVRVEIKEGAATLPSNVSIGFNMRLTDITADSQYNKHEGQYYDYESPHRPGGQHYVSIEAGQTRAEVRIALVNDDLVENIERLRVDLFEVSQPFAPSSAVDAGSTLTIAPSEGQVTIYDTTDVTSPQMRDVKIEVDEDVGQVEMVQILSPRLVQYDFTMIQHTVAQSAVSGQDYRHYSRTLEFETYQGQASTFLTIKDDDEPEGYRPVGQGKSVEVMYVHLLSNGWDPEDGLIINEKAYVHIRDDDPAFYVPLEARLDESTTIPIRISYPVPRTVSVAYDIVGAGYRKSGTAQFAAEQTEVLIPNATQRDKITTITLHSQSAGRIYDEAGNALADTVEYDLLLQNGQLQLADGANARRGRLEVSYNGIWGTVCDDRLDNPGNIAPKKACQFMGYATGELIPRGTVSLAPQSQPIWLDDVRCFANPQRNRNGTTPTKLHHCYHAGWGNNNCSHEEDVHLSCSGSSEQTEATPLTATLEDVPSNHDGSSAFTLRIAFSAEVDITAQQMRDHALTISNAAVTNATRVDGRSDLWELTVEPAGTGAISILVPLNRPCSETGALCTADGRMLSVAPAHQVPGPRQGTQPPGGLTPSFVSVPAEHDGETDFWLELRFNAALEQGSKTELRALLGATGGSVTKLRRKDGQLDHWRIRIEPSSHETVTVTLSPSPPCGATGAVCTQDGRTFTNGPATQIQGPPGLTVADTEVDEGPNASLAFAVTLSRAASSTVTVDYASANGTAMAGSDYTAISGTLTFAAGETQKTVAVPVLDDAIDDDGETLTLTLSNPNGAWLADATGIGTIHNSDPMPKAWITRFGRTVASQVVEAISQRLDGESHSHVTVGGMNLTPPQRFDPNGSEPPQWGGNPASEGELRTLTGHELLAGSAFDISNGETTATSPELSAWGRIATGGFEAEVNDVGMDAKVRTGFIAVDAQWDRMLAGVLLSQSSGKGAYRLRNRLDNDEGTIESTLTALYPYAGWELNDRVRAWSLTGIGTGELKLRHNSDPPIETSLGMRMAAVGVKGTVLDGSGPSGVGLSVKSDAMWVRTRSEGTERLRSAEGDVTRFRLLLDATRVLHTSDGATFTPSGQIGVRHDAGDAEIGTGLEMGASLRYSAGPLSVEGSVRALIAHQDNDYEEWGASGAIRLVPHTSGRGLSITVAPSWGVLGGNTERVWAANGAPRGIDIEQGEVERRLESELAYGLHAPLGLGVVTPYTRMTLAESGKRTLRAGARWNTSPSSTWNLEAVVDDGREGGTPSNALMMRAHKRW